MGLESHLLSGRFPRSDRYHPEWVRAGVSGGANSLWLTEWLASGLELRPGMRVLDLGCGRACSSVFLRREYQVQVWATDLWINASENLQRIQDAGVADGVFPLHADARALPFAAGFFDCIVCVDSFPYFGTDDLFLNYLAHFLKVGGQLGIVGAGFTQEIRPPVPEHLRGAWGHDFWSLHSADWWRDHWEKTGILEIELAETMPEGWRWWLEWQRAIAPDNGAEVEALEADQGRYLGYIRLVGRRNKEIALAEYCWPDPTRSLPVSYMNKPLLRTPEPCLIQAKPNSSNLATPSPSEPREPHLSA